MSGALEGIKILDLSRLLPFEYCTLMLADLGADVLKVEEPKIGDYMRFIPPILKKESALFCMLNRNKKSMTLNMREDEGKKIIRRLVKEYDVLFESFRPGVMKKLGLDYESLKEINPGLVFCSATGYGQNSPYKDRPGHDLNYISIAGILEATGMHTGAPVIPGVPVADMSIGIFSAFAILVGVIAKNRTGKGQYIDMSMTDCMLSYNIWGVSSHFSKQVSSDAVTIGCKGDEPCYTVFKTRDNKFISLGNIEDKFWVNFLKLVDKEDLKKFQFASGEKGKEAIDTIQKVIIQKTREEWLNLFEGKDICYSPVNSIEDVLSDPHIKQSGMIVEMEHPVEGKIPQMKSPFKFSETPVEINTPSPALGEHTDEVLKFIGYDKQGLDELKKNGVI